MQFAIRVAGDCEREYLVIDVRAKILVIYTKNSRMQKNAKKSWFSSCFYEFENLEYDLLIDKFNGGKI